ncbi:MAG: hypothetical protein ACPGQD_07200 [Planctomycetota bacterium]
MNWRAKLRGGLEVDTEHPEATHPLVWLAAAVVMPVVFPVMALGIVGLTVLVGVATFFWCVDAAWRSWRARRERLIREQDEFEQREVTRAWRRVESRIQRRRDIAMSVSIWAAVGIAFLFGVPAIPALALTFTATTLCGAFDDRNTH